MGGRADQAKLADVAGRIDVPMALNQGLDLGQRQVEAVGEAEPVLSLS